VPLPCKVVEGERRDLIGAAQADFVFNAECPLARLFSM
jgi:hypothetical protein